MHGDDHRRLALGLALGHEPADGVVKRQVDLVDTRLPLIPRQIAVARNLIDFADGRHGTVGLRRTVAIIGKPREALVDQRRIELARQQFCNGERPRIPGDVAFERLLRKAERTQPLGHPARRVFANENDFASAGRVLDRNRIAICIGQKSRQHRHPLLPR
ncbi:hypothetical protein D9M72_598710 [compost metagenome]